MDVIIQSLGFTASEDLETFVHEKMDKFNKESQIIRANVTLSIGADADPNKYCCEMRLEVPGNDLFIKKNADTFEKAIVSAADALQRSRRRAKEKLIDRNRTM
jgi:putative sigma-54 modulation protein